MDSRKFDLIAIGSGPACQKGAIQAAKLGKKVAIVERDSQPGGASLNSGTIPSKSLREAILDLTNFYDRSFYGIPKEPQEILISDLNFRLVRVLEEQRKVLQRQISRNRIEFVRGSATFIDTTTIAVLDDAGKQIDLLKGENILIGTGSRPRNPKNIPFDDRMILDSTRLLGIDRVPKKLLVLGSGVIGSEYASFFAALGTEVTVVDKREHMLPLLDREIGTHLQKALEDLNLRFLGQKMVEEVLPKKEQVVVKCRDKTQVTGDVLLYALGREASVTGLGLEKVGIALDQKGYIPVNNHFQTLHPHIYAVGDVIGGPCLASTSMEQGRLAARHAFGAPSSNFPNFFPIGIYTIPEISCCGLTEEQVKKSGIPYEVGRAYYYEIAKSQIVGGDPGMFKILFHKESHEILGVHIVGRGATEVIHIGQVAMTFKAKIDYLVDQVFNYPTYAEGYRIAALNGLNKLR
ncbi:MAG: Si-specific NAD(P)(+) transhydrogenase [Candidatus Algichlamydia australiensis]|nr:Si-specific NAD(P)(+) transhydrogenase [Chlamydiales bacterium]